MIAENQFVRLDKLSEQNAGILPNGYWCEGKILESPQVGRTIRLARTARAKQREGEPERVEVFGLYVSSPIQEMLENVDGTITCATLNSYWKITPLGEEKDQ